jgi:hypothetical protein
VAGELTLTPSDADAVPEIARQDAARVTCAEHGRSYVYEYRCYHPDGTRRAVMVACSAHEPEESGLGWYASRQAEPPGRATEPAAGKARAAAAAGDLADRALDSGAFSPLDAGRLRAAARNLGSPGPFDPLDADLVQRSFRLRGALESYGFRIAPESRDSVYPRGVAVELDSGHRLSLTPEGAGWNARIWLPLTAEKADAYLDAEDAGLPAAVRAFLARPDVQRELRRQTGAGREQA